MTNARVKIFLLLLFPLFANSQLCYTVMEDAPAPRTEDCDDISNLYDRIDEVKIYPRFHFIEFDGYQFDCNATNPNYDPVNLVQELLQDMNTILGNFAVNESGGEQLPNGGESKIRFFTTSDVYDCANFFFWETFDQYQAAVANSPTFNIAFYKKETIESGDTTYTQSGIVSGSGFVLHNVHHMIFVGGKTYQNVVDIYDGLAVHELFHVFGLTHSWLCSGLCGDMDAVMECGGVLSNGTSCGSACEGLDTVSGVWNNSNNTMGYNPEQDALTRCQYADAFDRIIEDQSWKFVDFNENFTCTDIIIDNADGPTTTWSCDKYLECNIEVTTGSELIMDNILVEMGSGTSIILHPGSRLILSGSKIQGIEKEKGHWEGIKILTGDGTPQYSDPYVDIATYSTTKSGTVIFELGQGTSAIPEVRDADIGLDVGIGLSKFLQPGGGLVHMQFGVIENCNTGIKFERFDHFNKSKIFNFSRFENNGTDMIIKENFGFHFETTTFKGENLSDPSYGIILYNSTLDQFLSNKFELHSYGILVFGGHPSLPGFVIGEQVFNSQTRFIDCLVGVGFTSQGLGTLENMIIKDSEFRRCGTGILSWGESEYEVYGNDFNSVQDISNAFTSTSSGAGTNDCYCNTVTNTSSDPTGRGFSFNRDNRNTSIFGNTFSLGAATHECIETRLDGDIFPIQATRYDPNAQIEENLPAGNDFKAAPRDLLIDNQGIEIQYLVPQDNSLVSYFPQFNSNYVELQSGLNPISCQVILGRPSFEPDTLTVGDNMPQEVKDDWPDPIGDPILQEDYILDILNIPNGAIAETERVLEVRRARYAQYNAVVAACTSPNYLSILQQLPGNLWKRLEYGYHMERADHTAADQVLQSMPINDTLDADFVFLQEIVLDKIAFDADTLTSVPFSISPTEAQQIRTIIDEGSIMSGYASALYFDLYGVVRTPTTAGGSSPRRIENRSESVAFTIYPNPARDVLYIEGLKDGAVIEFYDMYHTKVRSNVFTRGIALDISMLRSGIYFIKSGEYPAVKFVKAP